MPSSELVRHTTPRPRGPAAVSAGAPERPAPWPITLPLRAYNKLRRMLASRHSHSRSSAELREIGELASAPSDINEHLELIFAETLLQQPKLIAELGVRGGVSTFVFERAARLCNASIVSVDIDDCSTISSYENWHFYRGDDVQFAASFPEFCRTRGLEPSVDLLFVDTSHYYEHTVQEIAAWFPFLSARGKAIFHDTNLRTIGPRKDGCFDLSWDNQRGVIRAIEEYLRTKIDERREFSDIANGWLIRHWPNCNGLTILDRIA